MSVLARASVRYLARHPAQLALSVLGIALGVAVVVGIELASRSAQRAFELTSERLAGAATHVLRAGNAGIDEELYVRLRTSAGAPPLAPRVQRTVAVLDPSGGVARSLELVGIDPLAEGAFGRFRWPTVDETWPGMELVRKGGGAWIAADTARELAVQRGDEITLRIDSRVRSVAVVGLLEGASELERRSLAGLLVADVATAQELTGELGRITAIDVILPAAGTAREAAEAWLAARLPGGVALEPASARAESLAGMTSAFETNLRALGLLALFVGVFLVYNTVTFSVVQRRGLWAGLRTLGVTRKQVFGLVCGEALALGAAGTIAGLALGVWVGSGLVRLVTRTINDLYFAVEVSALELDPAVLARGALLGVIGTLAGALAPAREATGQAPRTAQLRSTLESRAGRLVPRLAAAGLLCLIASLALLLLAKQSLPASFVALFGFLLSAFCLAPAFTVAACALAARAPAGALGRMAARGIARNLSRNAVAIAALSIALAATAGIGLLIGSFRGSVERWLDVSLPSDVYVWSPHPVASRNSADLPPRIVDDALAMPGVEGHNTYRGFETVDEAGRTVFGAALGLAGRARRSFEFLAGDPDAIWERFERGEAILTEPFARRRGCAVGDEVALHTDRGLERARVAGVARDFTSDQGFVYLSRTTYERWFDDRGISSLGLFLAPELDAEAFAARLRAGQSTGESAHVQSNAGLRASSLEVFDRTFRVTAVLRLFAGAVAFAGVLSALLALQLEREREVGLLRALGLTPRQVVRLVLAETGLMGLIAGLFALPLAALLGWVLVEHVNARAFGWTLALDLQPGQLAIALGLSLAAAWLAGIAPAWRMSRIPPAVALRSE
jgi:putative ABC transport system permease protein